MVGAEYEGSNYKPKPFLIPLNMNIMNEIKLRKSTYSMKKYSLFVVFGQKCDSSLFNKV